MFRPTINYVERISWGKPAKQKGTGSRGIPHRLNEEERLLFDQARRKGFLEVAGSGWRSQRRDAPLLNTYRSFCDARGQPAIVLHKDKTGVDEVVVDLSPLRAYFTFRDVALKCLEHQPNGEIAIGEKDESDAPIQSNDDGAQKIESRDSELGTTAWSERPIYQLPPYCVTWRVPREEAKAICKKMAGLFNTVEKKTGGSKKPVGIRPGKGRRHGGYGIG